MVLAKTAGQDKSSSLVCVWYGTVAGHATGYLSCNIWRCARTRGHAADSPRGRSPYDRALTSPACWPARVPECERDVLVQPRPSRPCCPSRCPCSPGVEIRRTSGETENEARIGFQETAHSRRKRHKTLSYRYRKSKRTLFRKIIYVFFAAVVHTLYAPGIILNPPANRRTKRSIGRSPSKKILPASGATSHQSMLQPVLFHCRCQGSHPSALAASRCETATLLCESMRRSGDIM